MKKFGLAVVAAAAVGLFAGNAMAGQGFPSSQAAVAYGDLSNLVDSCAVMGATDINGNPVNCPGGATNDTGWVNVLRTFIKTPNGKDLAFDVALQCFLGELVKAKSSGGVVDSATAENNIRVRVQVTDVDDSGTPVGPLDIFASPNGEPLSLGAPDADPGSAPAENGVTYCGELVSLSAELQGILDLTDAGCFDADAATECSITPEEIQLVIESLRAHAFNFVLPNVGTGIKRITVQAKATSSASLGGSESGTAKGRAVLGLGSMLVETLRLVKGFDGSSGPIQDITELQ